MKSHMLKYVTRRSQISNCPDVWKGLDEPRGRSCNWRPQVFSTGREKGVETTCRLNEWTPVAPSSLFWKSLEVVSPRSNSPPPPRCPHISIPTLFLHWKESELFGEWPVPRAGELQRQEEFQHLRVRKCLTLGGGACPNDTGADWGRCLWPNPWFEQKYWQIEFSGHRNDGKILSYSRARDNPRKSKETEYHRMTIFTMIAECYKSPKDPKTREWILLENKMFRTKIS